MCTYVHPIVFILQIYVFARWKKAWTWVFEVRTWVQLSRLRNQMSLSSKIWNFLLHLIDLTANQDVHPVTQKSSRFLPITLFKLNQKQARCISKTDMSWLSKKYKWVGLKSRLSKNFMTYFQSCLYFSYGFLQKGKIVSTKFAKFFFLRDHFACEKYKNFTKK